MSDLWQTFWGNLAVNAPESDRKDLSSELEVIKMLKPYPHVIKLLSCVTESGKVLSEVSLLD